MIVFNPLRLNPSVCFAMLTILQFSLNRLCLYQCVYAIKKVNVRDSLRYDYDDYDEDDVEWRRFLVKGGYQFVCQEVFILEYVFINEFLQIYCSVSVAKIVYNITLHIDLFFFAGTLYRVMIF